MKKLYLSLSLSFLLLAIHLNTYAQSPVFFDPWAVNATINPNETALVHSLLKNQSDDTVEFSFPGYMTRDFGGPDSFGYSWIDSEEPNGPDWGWIDIAETGTLIEGLGDDMLIGPFEMGITFPYYGQEKNHFWLSPNGCISFDDQFLTYVNDTIPTNDNYIDFIAWFWDDLIMDTAISRVYYQNYDEKTVVQFTRMVHYPGTESYITGQVIMVNNGTIFMKYRMISETFETNSATVGLQSWNPEMGLQVICNEEYLHSEFAIRFDLNHNFIISVTPSSLTLPPDTQETIWVTYSSEGFTPGVYEQELKCVTSLAEYPQIFLHNVMYVSNPDQAGFQGYVTSASTGLPINDVRVSVGEQFVYTNGDGHYELPLEQGTYNVTFMREGYQTLVVEDTTALPGFSTLDVELGGFYFLVGRVFAGENPIETGFAYLYKMIEGSVVDIYAEMVGELGYYEFSGLASAHYIVKSEPSPNSMYYGDYLPTYYGDVLHWEEATVINLVQNTDGAHIHLVPVNDSLSGPCSITGTIDNSSRSANIPVILRTSGQESALMTYSSTDGSYVFNNLAYGSYEIFAEIPGKSITPQAIVLSEAQPVVEGIHMQILEDQIIFLGISESDIFENIPVIYPNPAKDRVNILLSLKKPSQVHIDITDLAGRVISSEGHTINGQQVLVLDVESLSKGIYLVKLEAGNEVIVRQVIKN